MSDYVSCRVSRFLIVVFLAFFFTGCAPKSVSVSGTVLQNGKPIEVSSTGSVMVTLINDVPAGTPTTNRVEYADAAGNFVIKDVLPGKYKVAVEQYDPSPAVDKLGGKFSAANTKLVHEVDGKTPLNIDIGMP